MSASRETLLFLVNYSIWANQQLLAACSTLTPEELTRDLGTGHTGVSGTLRHLYDAERCWLENLRAGQMAPLSEFMSLRGMPGTPPEADLSFLQERWPKVWEELRSYVETTPEAELAENITADDCAIPRWKIILHVVNHATLHRGQIMSMLRRLGKQPPGNDIFVGYFASQLESPAMA